ncbi:uncharacterized protein DS421_1g05780 [Arachis hypogaea]|nr:uncharacterized protein DS421_1g05780 [Arachis hypogaea]
MAEEEVVAPSASPLPSNCKRKFEDLDSEPTESNAKSNPDDNNVDAAVPDDGDNKRPRLDNDLGGAVSQACGRNRVDLESAVLKDGEPAEPKNDSKTSANEQGSGEVAEPAESQDVPSEGQEVPAEDAHEKVEKPPEEPAKDSAEQDLPPGIRNHI